jgi:hypothetical protein
MKKISSSFIGSSKLLLGAYDWWFFKVSNTLFWECPTEEVLLPFFLKNLSYKHLDVGVDTGYYLKNSNITHHYDVSILDINRSKLDCVERNLFPVRVKTYEMDVMEENLDGYYDLYNSISIFNLLHSLPGDLEDKEIVFINLKKMLRSNGIIYGTTILGEDVNHNFIGRKVMKIYNKKNIFGNNNDSVDSLKLILLKNFRNVDIVLYGKIALFEARDPI